MTAANQRALNLLRDLPEPGVFSKMKKRVSNLKRSIIFCLQSYSQNRYSLVWPIWALLIFVYLIQTPPAIKYFFFFFFFFIYLFIFTSFSHGYTEVCIQVEIEKMISRKRQRLINVDAMSWRLYNVALTSIHCSEVYRTLHQRRCSVMMFIECRINVDATS